MPFQQPTNSIINKNQVSPGQASSGYLQCTDIYGTGIDCTSHSNPRRSHTLKKWEIRGLYVAYTWLIGEESPTPRRPLFARNWQRPGSGFLPFVFGCASTFSRSISERLSKASRTRVEARSKASRTGLEQQPNTCRRNFEESCVWTHAQAPTRIGLGLALGMVVLLSIIMAKQVIAQEVSTVSGKVISTATGGGIEGATITNKRTHTHTITDRLGEYRIPAGPDDILMYSHVGYKTVEERVHGREQINVVLESGESMLEEVEINAGYYTVKDRERTGSISRITTEEIEKQPIRNPLEAMIGRMPGVQIEQVTGLPGGGFNIEIRGRNSISSGNRPLYIVNGVPLPDVSLHSKSFTQGALSGENAANEIGSMLDGLNPGDIESIEVLKDADATAIYGSRGANGVVLITTKKGKVGKARLNLGLNTGWGEVGKRMELLDTEQFLEMRRKAFINDGMEPNATNAPDLLLWDTTRYTDWQDVLIGGTARKNALNTSLSGGSANTDFLISADYMDEQSVYPTDDKYRKYGTLFSTNHASEDGRLQSAFSFNFVNIRNQLPTFDYASSVTHTPVAPPIYNEDGTLNWANGTWSNPLASTASSYVTRNANLNSRMQVSYSLFRGLKLSASIGYNMASINEIRKAPARSYNPAANITTGDSFSVMERKGTSYMVEPMVTYGAKLWRGTVSALLCGSYQNSQREMQTLYGQGFTNEGMMGNIRFAPNVQVRAFSQTRYRYAAASIRVNYDYGDRYLVNLTARRDGSSRFGPGQRFANFGAVGGAWVFSWEESVKDLMPFLSFGKLRGSYGVTGNDQITDYGYMYTYSSLSPRFQNQIGTVNDNPWDNFENSCSGI